jgi:hypothetical protein
LVALAVAIALSVACYVHSRSSTATSSKGKIKAGETFNLAMVEGTQAKKKEGTLAEDTEMGGYASHLNPMFQMDLSGGGSDSALLLAGGAMSQVLGGEREREREGELRPRFVVSGQYEYWEAVLDEASQDAFEGVSELRREQTRSPLRSEPTSIGCGERWRGSRSTCERSAP